VCHVQAARVQAAVPWGDCWCTQAKVNWGDCLHTAQATDHWSNRCSEKAACNRCSDVFVLLALYKLRLLWLKTLEVIVAANVLLLFRLQVHEVSLYW